MSTPRVPWKRKKIKTTEKEGKKEVSRLNLFDDGRIFFSGVGLGKERKKKNVFVVWSNNFWQKRERGEAVI